eukprot:328451-Lingulodinium_polyedra.AAC.1
MPGRLETRKQLVETVHCSLERLQHAMLGAARLPRLPCPASKPVLPKLHAVRDIVLHELPHC